MVEATYSLSQAAHLLGYANHSCLAPYRKKLRELGIDLPGMTYLSPLRPRVNDEWVEAMRYFIQHGEVEAGEEQHTVIGLTPQAHLPTPSRIWDRAFLHQRDDMEKTRLRYAQHIYLPGALPCGVAMLSDIHLGNEHTDYVQAYADAEIIRDTPGLYAAVLGDTVDNWVGPLEGISRNQPFTIDEEKVLVRDWLEMFSDALVAVVSGNHENRTSQMTGEDMLANLLRDENHLLYDKEEMTFTLHLGDAAWKIMARHTWPGNSMWNVTQGMERNKRMSDDDWDIGIGAHTHKGTFPRWGADGNRTYLALQLGCYQYDSKFARRLGLPRMPFDHSGSAALMFWPDGTMEVFRSLAKAAEFLRFARGEK